jgi:hypothetical protein
MKNFLYQLKDNNLIFVIIRIEIHQFMFINFIKIVIFFLINLNIFFYAIIHCIKIQHKK